MSLKHLLVTLQQHWVYQKSEKLCSVSLATVFSKIGPKSVCVGTRLALV
jgi:hypothetical protein